MDVFQIHLEEELQSIFDDYEIHLKAQKSHSQGMFTGILHNVVLYRAESRSIDPNLENTILSLDVLRVQLQMNPFKNRFSGIVSFILRDRSRVQLTYRYFLAQQLLHEFSKSNYLGQYPGRWQGKLADFSLNRLMEFLLPDQFRQSPVLRNIAGKINGVMRFQDSIPFDQMSKWGEGSITISDLVIPLNPAIRVNKTALSLQLGAGQYKTKSPMLLQNPLQTISVEGGFNFDKQIKSSRSQWAKHLSVDLKQEVWVPYFDITIEGQPSQHLPKKWLSVFGCKGSGSSMRINGILGHLNCEAN